MGKNKQRKRTDPFDNIKVNMNMEKALQNPQLRKIFGVKGPPPLGIRHLCGEDSEKRKKKNEAFGKFVKQMPAIIIAGGICLAILTFVDIYNSIPFRLYWYLSIGIYICFIALYFILLRDQKKSMPSKANNNQESNN